MNTTEHNGEVFTHEYYLCGQMPVIVYIDEKGGWRGTQAPSRDKLGELEFSAHATYIQGSGQTDIEKITEEEFNNRCQNFWAKIESGEGPKF